MRRPGRWILALLLLLAVGVAYWRGGSSAGAGRDGDGRIARVVPESIRIRVEVMNGTATRGLARQATSALRDAGFDVVGSGNWSEQLDSSLVLVRSGRSEWGALAAEVMGGARVQVRPDSSRYLDLTIVVGSAWRPPREAFHP